MSIRKFRAARVTTVTANQYVGQPGDMFYDEVNGQFRVSDGHTAGGHFVNPPVATTAQLGGVKAGPGANVSVDGTLTINTSGLPLGIGDLSINQANISTVNPNENLNLVSNGTGAVNLVGNLHVHTTSQNWFNDGVMTNPVLAATNDGNLTVNGNLITNGGTYLYGSTTFVGPTVHTGNLITNGNLVTNGSVYVNGAEFNVGNLTISGNLISVGPAYYVGKQTTTGDSTFIGNITANGNATINGELINNGPTINNGLFTQNGNLNINGNTVITVSLSSTNQGGLEITGNAQGLYQTPVNMGVVLQTTGPDTGTAVARNYFDSIGNYALVAGRRYNGTIANPSQVLANQDIVRYAGTGYTSSGWPTIGPARMVITASENLTATNQGGRIEFWATANGTVASTSVMRVATVDPAIGLTSDLGLAIVGNITAGNIALTGNVAASWLNAGGFAIGANAIVSSYTNTDIAIGQLTATANININRTLVIAKDTYANGNINVGSSHTITTPRVILNDGGVRQLTGNTAVTLDFSTDSMVSLTNPTGTVTITLANYTAGAIIRFIYSSVTARNINMGVAGAVNSTTGGTTLTGTGGGAQFGGTQSVVLTYYCVGGTAATTYVSASYV